MPRFQRMMIASLSLSLVVVAASVIRSQGRAPAAEWRYFGGNKAFTRYSPLDQINRDNVKNLRIVWRRPAVSDQLMQAFPDLRVNNYLRSTPIVIDGRLYAQNAHGLVVAFDGESGKTVWEQELFARTREEANGAATRGVDYWRGGAETPTNESSRFAASTCTRSTRKPANRSPGFGDQGRASLHFEENQPLAARFNDTTGPLIIGNVVVVTGNTAGAGDTGTFKKEAAPEDIRGFDAQTGKLLWTFHVVPRPGEFGNDTWGNDSWKIAGDLGAWNPMTADEELGYVYIPLTAPTASAYGVLAAGRQPLRRFAGRARCEDRKARLALPDRSPQSLGMGERRPGDARRYHRRWAADQGGDAAEQERLPVRAGSCDRQAGVADRGAAGAAIERARREDLADAAVSRPSRRLRSPGRDRRRSDRLHA